MTHDELLAKIDEGGAYAFERDSYGWVALRAVVELAKPVSAPIESQSYLLGWNAAMESIVEAIEKELK